MIELIDVNELDVTFGDYRVKRKINKQSVHCQYKDDVFIYKSGKFWLERVLFDIIDGKAIVICLFINGGVELIKYIDNEWKCFDYYAGYLFHNSQYLYLYSTKFMKIGADTITYHDDLIIGSLDNQLVCGNDSKCDQLLGIVSMNDIVDMINFDPSAVLFENSKRLVISSICLLNFQGDKRLMFGNAFTERFHLSKKTWISLPFKTSALNIDPVSPHIAYSKNNLCAFFENDSYLLPFKKIGYCNSWINENILFIKYNSTRAFVSSIKITQIINLIPSMNTFTCFLIWCLCQKTRFSRQKYKHYLPYRLFVDRILSFVLVSEQTEHFLK